MVRVNRLAEKFARWYYSNALRCEPVSFGNCFSDYSDCLILMPHDLNQVLAAASKLPSLAEIFDGRVIKVLLTSGIDPRSHEFIKRFTIIKPYSSDVNAFYLPKRSFVARVVGHGLSACIDLDFGDNFFNSCICALSGAPVRIGCVKGMGLPYYNLEIDVGGEGTPLRVAYDFFVKVLYRLKSEGRGVVPIET